MATRTRPYSWAISLLIIIVFAAALAYALMTSIPVHGASVARGVTVPGGWHALYNEGQGKCLNLVSGADLQRCDARDEDQQYAALTSNDGTLLLLSRATAQCVSVADRNTVDLSECNRAARDTSLDWTARRLGRARFHLLSEGRALASTRAGRGGTSVTLARVDNGDLNQTWQFR